MLIIGCDPDCSKYGIAIYDKGKLIELKMLDIGEIAIWLSYRGALDPDIRFSIEDVLANKFVYARNVHPSKAAQSKIAISIGRCQQSQKALMDLLNAFGIPYELHKPQKGNWAKSSSSRRPLFEKATGWTGRSNEDTRSAAYMGWLALK